MLTIKKRKTSGEPKADEGESYWLTFDYRLPKIKDIQDKRNTAHGKDL